MLPRAWCSRPPARGGTRSSVLALLLAAGLLAGPLAGGAVAEPGDQPGGTTGVLDSAALDRLQERAAQVQEELRAQQAEVVAARGELRRARVAVSGAESALADAEGELARSREVVADYARAVYRDGGAMTPLTLLLSGNDPGAMVGALGLLDRVDRHAAAVIGDAERERVAAQERGRDAGEALDRAQARAQEVADRVTELEDAAAAVTAELDDALAVVDRQLAELQRAQVEVDRRTAANWRAYRAQLDAAAVVPPPAVELRDPVSGLPGALLPVAAADGGAQPGAAQLPGAPSSLLVLPAETLDAVSAAMDALGAPYAPGTGGPDSWSCGRLVQSVYARADIELPDDQAELFAVTPRVPPADVLPGDLVFLGTEEAGLGHVGIALDATTMLAADGRAGAVVVRSVPAADVIAVGRPSLGRQDPVRAPGPRPGVRRVECGNPVHPPTSDGVRAWGGYPNGLIPPSAMCPLGVGSHQLRCDAAAAWRAMAAAFETDLGSRLCLTDSYRSYAGQVRLYGEKPALAAVPGTSTHGWGLATDLCGGVEHFGTPQYRWMVANAGRFGWQHPTWADPGNGREEPWHWEFAGS